MRIAARARVGRGNASAIASWGRIGLSVLVSLPGTIAHSVELLAGLFISLMNIGGTAVLSHELISGSLSPSSTPTYPQTLGEVADSASVEFQGLDSVSLWAEQVNYLDLEESRGIATSHEKINSVAVEIAENPVLLTDEKIGGEIDNGL